MAPAPDRETPRPPTRAVANAAEAWAEYARTASLYPEASPRVQAAYEALLETIRAGATGGCLVITMSQEHLRIGSKLTELDAGSGASWLRERLRSTGLDGVKFTTRIPAASLRAFTLRLTDLHQRGGKPAEGGPRWPLTYDGIELVYREFEGRFDQEAPDDRNPLDTHAADEGLVSRLSVDGPVSASVTRISEQLSGLTLPGESEALEAHHVGEKMLAYVVQCIPTEARDAYGEVVNTTNDILGTMESILQDDGSDLVTIHSHADDVDLRALVYAASRRFFTRAMPARDVPTPELRNERGHAGDEDVKDDLSSLLLELNGLPIVHDIRLEHADVDNAAEQVNMLLRLYLEQADEVDTEALLSRARPILRDIREEDFPALRTAVEFRLAADETLRPRIIQFFSDVSQARLLRACGILTPEHVIRNFPRDFGVYVDGIDMGRRADYAELEAVLVALPPERIQGSLPTLLHGAESLLVQGRAQRLLGTGDPRMLPFVEAVLGLPDGAGREAVVGYLRIIGRNHMTCALLEVTTEPSAATSAYLKGISRSIQYGGVFPDVMAHQLLVIDGLLAAPSTSERIKVCAVAALGRIGTPEAARSLRRLVHRRLGLFPTQPQALREAARSALARIRNRNEKRESQDV